MALDKQIYIYGIDTSAFYSKDEEKIHNNLSKMYFLKKKLSDKTAKINKSKDKELEENKKFSQKANIIISRINRRIKKKKDKLYSFLNKNQEIRELNSNHLNKRNIISVFESSLTRTLQLSTNSLSTDIMVVQTYFFKVIEDIILEGFIYSNEKYVCLTASAGQIRTKKTVFIKEKLLLKHQNTLMCGLTIDDINKLGGVNINKYLAYLALANSATDIWQDFDIDKAIVVEDMETTVRGLVDFIDDKTYEITRQEMDIPICHTDGCGMFLPKISNKSFMVRLPWIKGLLVPFLYKNFIEEYKCSPIIKDIYGKEYNIIEDDIQIIFTKSQFKMWKYYKSWQHYKDNYKKYKCHAGKCNEEEDEFGFAKLNYQMLQTLVDITDKELQIICKRTKNNIMRIGYDRKTMFKVLGVTKTNTSKNYFQQAVEIYPELLNDTYSKEILKQVKKKMVKEARAAKIDINGKYTFIIPDLFSFCEFLFLDDKNPKGLLEDGEVYCNLYKDKPKLNCLRSPHLFREWAVRNNIVDNKKRKWFITNGLYTSCHDLISKILQFDNDGDSSLVLADNLLIEIAERNMKDIVPLYYKMAKADAEKLNNQSIFNGLKTAYSGGNIGMISNNITKIWNSNNINLDVIKLLCMESNFTIDYAKTLYKPERPKKIKGLITNYTKYKVPHFFIYAKDKKKYEVEEINKSVVNRLEKIIPNPQIKFKSIGLDNFNYKMLMGNDVDILEANAVDIINKYTELDLRKRFMTITKDEDVTSDTLYLYKDIRNQILDVNYNIKYVVDVLVKYLYEQKESSYKTTLWSSFGNVIIDNIKNNINTKLNEGYLQCEECNNLILPTNNKMKYCDYCAREIKNEQNKKYYYLGK